MVFEYREISMRDYPGRMSEDDPATRLRRGAKLGGAVARQAVDRTVTRATTRSTTPEQRAAAEEKAALRAADRLVAVLGSMRGAAMKVGQALATVDLGLVPEHALPAFQEKLTALTDRAPGAEFGEIDAVIAADCPRGAFAEIDPEPMAAASIGQVHRAVTADGRDVAVKVQYPGIEAAIRADLKNLGLLLTMWRGRRATAIRTESVLMEISETILAELDYQGECAAQAKVARRYADHPFIRVPAPLPELSGPRVLVTEFVTGERFGSLEAAPRADRDRAGEILHRFYVGGVFGDGEFCGDPHAGNVLVCPDGRLAFLDYGLYKTLGPESGAFERDCFTAADAGRGDELAALLRSVGALRGEGPDPDTLLRYFRLSAPWHLRPGVSTITPAEVKRAVAVATTPPPADPPLRMPAAHTFSRRAELLTFGMIGNLESSADWHAICREWIYGDAPATELGREHAAWLRRE
ncbi:ABC-1 domain protein OS=Tsukamurella paurometabola (strain ATCC 8368 / DSM / CCUG 35730 / CIP 100753 / JCM 10117 / KCTC 9821 / NBRC 16120 / NCIMB 702349/ NCTC 13040) OX=521096 GN=Tpau_3445 PE=4 SV=1 [Tsukamurella paurometabola]|nr:Probable ubiquinone biosynthesis protein UbiB [Tsukamurella paurometabola]